MSIDLEAKFSKNEILAMYLNEIPYGSNAYGIEAAAQTFFGKHARDLSLDEAALLAVLPKAPSYFSPYGSHPEDLLWRQHLALEQMARLGYITVEQAEMAKNSAVLEKISPNRENIFAPHFVIYVQELLERTYGRDLVEKGGLKVFTTLDWEKQKIAEQVVAEGAEKNLQKYDAENAALVAIDPQTGQILAMVGSKNFFDTTIDGQVNVAIRDRQPGSSFKPYVYLAAFEKGYTPNTLLFDVETEFDAGSSGVYKPQNYDGKFRGPLTMKEALGMSLNIPAVKTLYLVGVKDAIAMAHRLGLGGLQDPDRYGLSLVLGGGEIKLLEHTSAFATLATGGLYRPSTPFLRIEDSKGALLESFQQTSGERVVEEKYVAILDHILSTNAYRADIFGERSPLRFDDRSVVAKTGTTNEFRDGWTMGYAPSLAVGVWAGNNDNHAMASGADGVVVAAPIWRSFMDKVLQNYPPENFPKYEEEKTGKDVLDGKLQKEADVRVCEVPDADEEYCLANKYCPSDEQKKKDFVRAHSILYYVQRDDPRGESPTDPKKDPQFKEWESGVEKWYKKEKGKNTLIGEPPEKECDEKDFKKFKPSITLSVPSHSASSSLTILADISAPYGVSRVSFFVDGADVGSRESKPFEITVTDLSPSSLTIRVVVLDKNGNTASAEKEVVVAY